MLITYLKFFKNSILDVNTCDPIEKILILFKNKLVFFNVISIGCIPYKQINRTYY